MRYLGIDYGSQRIGVAISDGEGRMAFPELVLENNNKALDVLAKFIIDNEVGVVVIGESQDFQGKPNKIQEEIDKFAKELEARDMEFEVVFEPEFLTSAQAASIQGKTDMLDASAAAIILQSYLDRIKN